MYLYPSPAAKWKGCCRVLHSTKEEKNWSISQPPLWTKTGYCLGFVLKQRPLIPEDEARQITQVVKNMVASNASAGGWSLGTCTGLAALQARTIYCLCHSPPCEMRRIWASHHQGMCGKHPSQEPLSHTGRQGTGSTGHSGCKTLLLVIMHQPTWAEQIAPSKGAQHQNNPVN